MIPSIADCPSVVLSAKVILKTFRKAHDCKRDHSQIHDCDSLDKSMIHILVVSNKNILHINGIRCKSIFRLLGWLSAFHMHLK